MGRTVFLSTLVSLLLLISCGLNAGSKDSNIKWLTDYDKAIEQSVETGKPIFVDFTGSDWCGWCIKLDEEVFSHKVFEDYMEKTFVPLMLDFPRSIEQSEELKKRNKELATKYGIRGFPTILILNSKGEEIGKTGYQAGGPEKYIEHLKGLVK